MKTDNILILQAEIGAVVIALCLFLQHHFNIDIFFPVILISGSFLLFYIALTERKNKNEIKLKFKINLLERDKEILILGGIAILSLIITGIQFREFWYLW